MRDQWKLSIAAAFVVAGLGLTAVAQETAAPPAQPNQVQENDEALRRHTTVDTSTTPSPDDDRTDLDTAAAPDAEDIHKTLAQATEAAVKEGTFDDLVERFVDADRNRIGEADLNEDRFNVASERFRQAWEDRFGSELEIEDRELVFDRQSFRIMQSEIGGEARTVGDRMERMLDRTGERLSDAADRVTGRDRQAELEVETHRTTADGQEHIQRETETEVDVQGEARVAGRTETPDRERVAGGDENREPGRKIATVTLPASHGLPQTTLELIREFPDSWKIEVPNHVDAQRLHANLQRELDRLADMQAQWPDDQAEAQRMVVHAVLLAISDKDSQASGLPGQDQLRHQPGQLDQLLQQRDRQRETRPQSNP
jgi:hypothetical protein